MAVVVAKELASVDIRGVNLTDLVWWGDYYAGGFVALHVQHVTGDVAVMNVNMTSMRHVANGIFALGMG